MLSINALKVCSFFIISFVHNEVALCDDSSNFFYAKNKIKTNLIKLMALRDYESKMSWSLMISSMHAYMHIYLSKFSTSSAIFLHAAYMLFITYACLLMRELFTCLKFLFIITSIYVTTSEQHTEEIYLCIL
jgi:hypothetical protein